MTSQTESQSLTLSDGRTLAYTTYGASPSPHLPIFYQHGSPTSRLDAALWHDVALALNLQLIAMDRPGIGLSAPQSSRTILDWPSDVLALADHLQIQQFSVLGFSAGGPYVLSCAKVIQKTRLKRAGVISGLYPVALGTDGMLFDNRWTLWLAASWLSPLLVPLLEFVLGKKARNNHKAFEEAFEKDLRSVPEVDRRCFEDNEVRTRFLSSMREAFRTDSKGVARDVQLMSLPWGFELTEIDAEGLTLWHGALDVNAPVTMARKAVKMLKGAELKEFEAEGHFSLAINQIKEILETFAGDTTGLSAVE